MTGELDKSAAEKFQDIDTQTRVHRYNEMFLPKVLLFLPDSEARAGALQAYTDRYLTIFIREPF